MFINKNLSFDWNFKSHKQFRFNHWFGLIFGLPQELPDRITSDEERELLSLMLRVHELEAEKMMLHSERLVKQQELRRRETMIIRYDRQRQISDEIITRQRRIMEGNKIKKNIL